MDVLSSTLYSPCMILLSCILYVAKSFLVLKITLCKMLFIDIHEHIYGAFNDVDDDDGNDIVDK